jgi:hypothetical protein
MEEIEKEKYGDKDKSRNNQLSSKEADTLNFIT